jgi:hypothetical protein
MSSETNKKPTPEGQCAIDVARLYGLDEDDDRWGPLVLAIVVLGLYFGVKLLFIVGGGYCKHNDQSTTFLNHQSTNQSAIYLEHQTNHPWEKQNESSCSNSRRL